MPWNAFPREILEFCNALRRVPETERTADALTGLYGTFDSSWRRDRSVNSGGGIPIPPPRSKAIFPRACSIEDAELSFVFVLGDSIEQEMLPARCDFQVRVRGTASYNNAVYVELEDHWRVDTHVEAAGGEIREPREPQILTSTSSGAATHRTHSPGNNCSCRGMGFRPTIVGLGNPFFNRQGHVCHSPRSARFWQLTTPSDNTTAPYCGGFVSSPNTLRLFERHRGGFGIRFSRACRLALLSASAGSGGCCWRVNESRECIGKGEFVRLRGRQSRVALPALPSHATQPMALLSSMSPAFTSPHHPHWCISSCSKMPRQLAHTHLPPWWTTVR